MQASVLFLRLSNLAAQPLPEQERRRQQLLAAARSAAACWPDDARVVLDAADGFAIVGRGDPRLALQAAQRATDPALAIGLHQGEVEASQDEAQGTHLHGEALATAAALADRAAAGAIERSPAFDQAVAVAKSQGQRRGMLGAAALAGIVGVGGLVRLVRGAIEAARPAVIVLDIRPAGEVLVDGELKGTSPPLIRLSLAPGAHSIEIRHGRFKPLKIDVHLQPGEEMQLRHVFASGGGSRRPGLIDRLKSWL